MLKRVELYRRDDPDGFVRVVPRRKVQVVVQLHRHLVELLELWRGEILGSEWGDGREHVLGVYFKLGRAGGERCCLGLYLQRRVYERRRWGMSGVCRWHV